jgi:DNA-binding response OmpR family regulator
MSINKGQTILIVDDEATVREVVRRYLEKDGFIVLEAETGPQALDLLYHEQPDLVVLDIMLPGLDGFTIMRSLREPVERGQGGGSKVPVIMLTARTEEEDRLVGFELGADDYVVKPFSPRELVMRVRAVLRRSMGGGAAGPMSNGEEPVVFGALRLEPATRRVSLGEQAIELTAKEFDLLWFLARHPRQVFSRTQLLDKVWGYEFYGDESTVTVHIHRLREKIEPDPANPSYVHTVWGVGYRFEVEED